MIISGSTSNSKIFYVAILLFDYVFKKFRADPINNTLTTTLREKITYQPSGSFESCECDVCVNNFSKWVISVKTILPDNNTLYGDKVEAAVLPDKLGINHVNVSTKIDVLSLKYLYKIWIEKLVKRRNVKKELVVSMGIYTFSSTLHIIYLFDKVYRDFMKLPRTINLIQIFL